MRKSEDYEDDDTEMTTKRSKKSSKDSSRKKKKGKKTKKEKIKSESDRTDDTAGGSELQQSYENREDSKECLNHLQTFYNSLNNVDLDNLITKRNVKYFQNLNPQENIEIDLYLSKIYAKIFSSDGFYNNFFSDEDENSKKVPLVMDLIEEAIEVIDNFGDYFISLENFELKQNLLKLIKFIYINLKEDITDEEEDHLSQLIKELPNKFYSDNYIEIIKFKNTIYKNNNELLKNIEEIDNLFFELGSYYEQLNCIELLLNDIESEEKSENNYISVSKKDIKKKKNNKKKNLKSTKVMRMVKRKKKKKRKIKMRILKIKKYLKKTKKNIQMKKLFCMDNFC